MALITAGADLAIERVTLTESEFPSMESTAAKRVSGQPPHIAVTAATLVGEIAELLVRDRPQPLIEFETGVQGGRIRTVVRGAVDPPCQTKDLGGLARLMLERLAAAWGYDQQSGEIWFELAPAASGQPGRTRT